MDKDKIKLAEALERANNYWIMRMFPGDYERWSSEEYLLEIALDRWFARKERHSGTKI